MGVSYLRRRPGGGVSELVAELFPRAAASGSESAHAMAHPCPMASAEDVFAATASLPAVAADNALSTSTPLAAQSPSPPSLATAARLPSAFAPSVRSLAQAQQQHEQIVAQHQHFQHMQRVHSQQAQQAQQAQLIAPPGGKSGAFVQQLAHIQALLQLEQERFSRQQAEQLMLHQSTMMRLTAAAAAAAASAVEASEAGVSAAASAANVLRLQRVNSLAGSISQLVSEGSAPPSPVGREASESARTVVLTAPSGGGGAKRPRSVSGDGGCSLGDEVGSASSSGSASPSQEPAFKRECALASLPTFVGGPLRPLAVPMPAAHAPVPGLPSHLDVATLALMVKS